MFIIFFRVFFIIGLSFSIISCGGGAHNSKAEDSYLVADRLVKSLAMQGDTTDPWLKGVYKFSHEQCYNGGFDNNNVCAYAIGLDGTSPKIIKVTENEIQNQGNSYKLNVIQSYQIGKYVYTLTKEHDLWICNFDGQCTKTQGKYNDILALDFNENACSSDECKSDGEKYRSLLVLTEPKEEKRGSYYVATSELQQVFMKFTKFEDKDNSVDIVTRASISNDVPIAELVESGISRSNILDYSFTMVTENNFDVQLIYERHQNKGGAYQTYYGGFEYGQNLIKQNISKNDNPVRVNKLDHLTLFTPVAQVPLFEGKSTYLRMVEDVRNVAGGDKDKDDNYEFCSGLGIYCILGVNYGYDAIKHQNYTGDIINNAMFFGLMHVSGVAFGSLGELINKSATKITSKNIFARFASGGLKTLSVITPMAGNVGTLGLAQVYGTNLDKLYYGLTTNDYTKNLPLLSSTAQNVLNMPLERKKECSSVGNHTVCADVERPSACEFNVFKHLSQIELDLKLNPNKVNLNNSRSLYDIYSNTKECDSQFKSSLSTEQNVIMKQVLVDSLRNFRSSVVGLVYQKLFIESNNASKNTLEIGNGDLDFFESDISIKDTEQPAADISLRLPNCRNGVCDATYFQDGAGNWLKNKNGKYLSAVNGNFLYVYYYRTDDEFKIPVFGRPLGQTPANLTYGINVYQLSDLTCDQFNIQIARMSDNPSHLAVYAGLRNRDNPAIIVDKMGNACNYNGSNYKNMVYKYDEALVGDLFMMLPLSTDPVGISIMYFINATIGVFDELQRLNALNPYYFSIRNGHANVADSNNYNCSEVNLKLVDGEEELKQASPSRLEQGGLWVIGDKGLHYIDTNDNEKERFKFHAYGTGVASSYNGKLLVSAVGGVGSSALGATYVDRYDENNLLKHGYLGNDLASQGKLINIDDYQEGHFPDTYATNFMGKLYADHNNRVYASYTFPIRQGIAYVWDINSWSKLGWVNSSVDGGLIHNFALTGDDKLVWVPENSKGFKGIDFNNSDIAGKDLVNGLVLSQNTKPYVFTIGHHVFAISDQGKVWGTDYERTKINQLDSGAVPLFEQLEDATGLNDGRFYLLTKKKLYSCKMPEKYLDKEPVGQRALELGITKLADKFNFLPKNFTSTIINTNDSYADIYYNNNNSIALIDNSVFPQVKNKNDCNGFCAYDHASISSIDDYTKHPEFTNNKYYWQKVIISDNDKKLSDYTINVLVVNNCQREFHTNGPQLDYARDSSGNFGIIVGGVSGEICGHPDSRVNLFTGSNAPIAQPIGNYLTQCNGITWDGDLLSATCPVYGERIPQWNFSSLRVSQCKQKNEVYNKGGKLAC